MSVRTAIVASAVFLAFATGNPVKLSLLADAANATSLQRMVCSSGGYRYSYCAIDTSGGVQLANRLSNARCQFGKSWGYDRDGVWVDKGCSAEFLVSGRAPAGRSATDPGRRASRDAAAIIVGGIVGAILDNNSQHGHHSDNYYPRPRPRHDNQWIDPTPQFDRDGNPNFDTHGSYQGCHGVGCMVDNPDYSQDGPPEPSGYGEQPHFSRQDGPPEPGQTTFDNSDDDE